MKSIKLKTTCNDNHVHTTLANPLAPLGDFRQASVQIRQINNIPEGVDHYQAVKLWQMTCDLTRIMTGKQRMEFDFSELGEGRIIKI
jgi:hypothetical protein